MIISHLHKKYELHVNEANDG